MQFNAGYYSVSEAAAQATITVVRTGDVSNAETVDYTTRDASAHAGVRYTATSGTLSFSAGQTSATFAVDILNSPLVNYNQSLEVQLRNPGGAAMLGAQASAVLLIIDDQGTVSTAFLNAKGQETGRGINSLQYLPGGNLVQLLWINNGQSSDLVYFLRNDVGNWAPETIDSVSNGSGLGVDDSQDAQLLIDSHGIAHVLEYKPDPNNTSLSVLEHFRRDARGWTLIDSVSLQNFCKGMVAAIAQDDSLHVAFWTVLNLAEELWYGNTRAGQWSFSKVTEVPLPAYGFGLRNLDLAVDTKDAAYIAYSTGIQLTSSPTPPYGSENSALAFATNEGGAWGTQVVAQHPDPTGDAGLYASIAIGPGHVVAMAGAFIPRVLTGSAASSSLHFFVRGSNGIWISQVVASASAGYAGSDGPQFTGGSPLLRFDLQENAEIVFTDVAHQHRDGEQEERSGQLRLAVLQHGSWNTATIIAQGNSLAQGLDLPTFAFSAAGVAYAGQTYSGTGPDGALGQFGTRSYVIQTIDVGTRLAARIPGIASAIANSDENYGSFIAKAYQTYLHRPADPAGINYWIARMHQDVTDEKLEANFLSSPEYIAANGGVNGVAGQGWVAGMYRDLLDRVADPGGLSYWTGQIASGVSPFAIAMGFAASPERESTRINSDYEIYLDREVDPAGLSYWLNQFVQNTARNEDLIAGFLSSQEYYFNHGGGTVPTWIESLYEDVLHRATSNQELQGWIAFATS
jgi:hypothetical protein